MDRGGRLTGSLNLRQAPEGFAPPPHRFARFVHQLAAHTGRWRVLRGIEIIFVTVLLAATALYGAIRGGHADAIVESLHDVADTLAQRAGYQSATITIEGTLRISCASPVLWNRPRSSSSTPMRLARGSCAMLGLPMLR